jgi:hypothetical protein
MNKIKSDHRTRRRAVGSTSGRGHWIDPVVALEPFTDDSIRSPRLRRGSHLQLDRDGWEEHVHQAVHGSAAPTTRKTKASARLSVTDAK